MREWLIDVDSVYINYAGSIILWFCGEDSNGPNDITGYEVDCALFISTVPTKIPDSFMEPVIFEFRNT